MEYLTTIYNYFYSQPENELEIKIEPPSKLETKPVLITTNMLLQGISNLKSIPNLGRNICPVDKTDKYFKSAPRLLDEFTLIALLANLKPIQPMARPVYFPPRQLWLQDIQEGNYRLRKLTKIN